MKTPTHGNHGNGNGGDELCNGIDHKGSNGSNGRKKGSCYIYRKVCTSQLTCFYWAGHCRDVEDRWRKCVIQKKPI